MGNRVVWNAWDYPGNTGVVWAYDLSAGTTEKLLELTSDAEQWTWLAEVGRPGLLVHREVWDSAANASTTSFELHGFDGRVHPVVEVHPPTDSLVWPELPRFAGSLLVYQAPATGAWTIFDPATDTAHTINPFGE